MLPAFVTWLHGTALSAAFRVPEQWLWPVFESLHFFGLALLIGIAGFFDLRLLGFMKRIPISAAADLMPWALVGFGINLATGFYFYVAEPFQYSYNIAWWYKVASLVIAVANAGFFQFMLSSKMTTLKTDEDTPASFKVIGAMSIVAWLSVLFWGRMLPFWAPPAGGQGL